MKRQPTEWEKLFANGMTDKGLISKINKQLIQLKIQKTNNLTKIQFYSTVQHGHPIIHTCTHSIFAHYHAPS